MNTRIATLLTLALAATALAQTPPPPGIRRLPAGRSLPASRPTSQSYIAPTAKSDDLVESPATNVVKGAFGYTLGAIWDGKIPEEAEPDKNGEVSVPVEAKESFEPFSSVTLSISTNGSRIACIAAETPRMALAESYAETCEKIGEIAAKVADGFGVKAFVTCHTNVLTSASVPNLSDHQFQHIFFGKMYRAYLENHPNDPDFIFYKDITVSPLFWYTILPIAGSRYNERPVVDMSSTPVARYAARSQEPDYLQQIWQPFKLSADCYPYTGEAVIRFSVRDVEDRTEHTNLISVAEIKKQIEEDAEKRAVAVSARAAAVSARRLPGRTQLQLSEEEKAKVEALKKAEQAFKGSLYRLAFAEAVEKSKENDPEALLRIALAYVDGRDIDQDSDKAHEYIEKACALKYGYAEYVYGLSYVDFQYGSDRCWHFGLDYWTIVKMSGGNEDYPKAARLFGQALSNGVSFAEADLEFARRKLKDAEEEEERKKKNAELLKGITSANPQKGETGSVGTDENADNNTPGIRRIPSRRQASRAQETQTNAVSHVELPSPPPSITNAASRVATPPSASGATNSVRKAMPTTQSPSPVPEKPSLRDLAIAQYKESIRRLSFEDAAAKSKENNPEALTRVALAFAEGKEVSKNLTESGKRLSAASERGYGIAQYIQGLVAGANMFSKRSGLVQGGYYTERNARWRNSLSAIGWSASVMERSDFRPTVNSWMWFLNWNVTEEQRLEHERALAEQAVSNFEKAVANGISIAQEDLDIMRKELAAVTKELEDFRDTEEKQKQEKQQSDDLKRRNEELLKSN